MEGGGEGGLLSPEQIGAHLESAQQVHAEEGGWQSRRHYCEAGDGDGQIRLQRVVTCVVQTHVPNLTSTHASQKYIAGCAAIVRYVEDVKGCTSKW